LRILAILGGLLAGLVVVLAAGAYMLLRPQAMTAQLSDAVQAATGYTLTVGGRPEYRLWPEPAISYPKVTLEASKTVAGGAPLTAERLVIATSFSDFLTRNLRPKSIEAQGARFNLLIDNEGKANWPDKPMVLPVPLAIRDGTLAFLDERTGVTFVASGLNARIATGESGEDLQSFGEMVWRKQPVRYTLQLKSVARLMADGSPLSLTANGPLADFYFDGRAGLAKGLALAGQISVNSDDLRGLARWLGGDIEPGNGFGSFTLAGAIDTAGRKTKITRATVLLDDTTAHGTLSLDVSGRIPVVAGDLVADSVDLATYLGEGGRPAENWSEAPFALGPLKAFDLALDLACEVASYGELELRDIRTRITQNGGTLRVTIPQMRAAGGPATATVEIDASRRPPRFFAMFNGSGIAAQPFLRHVLGFGALTGPANISAVLNGEGASQAEMIATLKGTASITVTNGSIERVEPSALLSRVSTQVVEGWLGERATPFKALGASFAIADGIASLSSMSYMDGQISMAMAGEADLLRRAVSFRATPRLLARDGASQAWPVAIKVEGPWNKPKLFPDVAGLPDNPEEGYRKLKSMGVPALQSIEQN
jgi:AsmA protein